MALKKTMKEQKQKKKKKKETSHKVEFQNQLIPYQP